MTKKITNIGYGLFEYKGVYFWRNITDIPRLLRRFKFLLKHGYSPVARWEGFNWFIDVMEDILTSYRFDRAGNKFWPDVPEDQWDEKTNEMFDEMISCLHRMEETDSIWKPDTDIDKYNADRNAAKEKFFKLFSDYFYDLWD